MKLTNKILELLISILSFCIRFLLAIYASCEMFFTNHLSKFFPSKYRISGKCKMDGVCCKQIFIDERLLNEIFFFSYLLRFWILKIYPFEMSNIVVETDEFASRSRMLRCKNLGSDNRCKEYFLRPLLCRNYPRKRYFKKLELHKNCGFYYRDTHYKM